MQILSSVFTNHPASVGESYGQHFRFAFGFSLKLFGAAFAALIHALIPCLFEKTASTAIREMHSKITDR